MQRLTKADWIGVLLPPLVAAIAGSAFLHMWTRPGSATLLLEWRWSFGLTLPRLLPTLIAMSFAYRLSILPYIGSRARRSSLMLTLFAGPSLAICVFLVAIPLLVLNFPRLLTVFWHQMLDLVSRHRFEHYGVEWLWVLAMLFGTFVVFVVTSGFLPSDAATAHTQDTPSGRNALLGVLLIGAFSLPVWQSVIVDLKTDGARATCIMNIRNVQQAMRSYQGMKNLGVGHKKGFSKWSIVGPGNFIGVEPVCPVGGTYWWAEDRIPAVGELMLHCSCRDHVPTSYSDW